MKKIQRQQQTVNLRKQDVEFAEAQLEKLTRAAEIALSQASEAQKDFRSLLAEHAPQRRVSAAQSKRDKLKNALAVRLDAVHNAHALMLRRRLDLKTAERHLRKLCRNTSRQELAETLESFGIPESRARRAAGIG